VAGILGLVERLYPYAYSVTGRGSDAAAEAMRKELDFEVLEYASGRELNGWLIPHECVVEKAEIRRDGALVYDGSRSALGVPAQSSSFRGRLSLDELDTHLFTVPGDAEAIPYHWTRLYRPTESIWGFCMPHKVRQTMRPGHYDVELVTRSVPTTMKVLVHELKGESERAVILNAHNCHPFQANDDTSGVAVGIAAMRRLAQAKRRRFSYILVVAPELFGPAFWLDEMEPKRARRLAGAIMLKSVGNDRALRLQQSFTGKSFLDLAAHNVYRSRFGTYEWGEFRALYGNDETVFEAPPYCLPSISLTRWPFPEYHTDQDVPQRLSEARLQDALETLLMITDAIEANVYLEGSARGLVCLSRHGLYKPAPEVGKDGADYESLTGRWNRLMNSLPRHLDGKTGLLEVAERYRLPIGEVHDYAKRWVEAKETG